MSTVVEELVVKTNFTLTGQDKIEKANKALDGTKKRAEGLKTAGKGIRDFFGGIREGMKQELALREKNTQGIVKADKKSRGVMLGMRRAARVVGRELGDKAGAFQWLSQVWRDLPGWGKLVAVLFAAGGAALALAKNLAEVITKNRKAAFGAGKLNTNATNQSAALRGIAGFGRIGNEQATEIGNDALGKLREKQIEKLKAGNKSSVSGVNFFDKKGQQRQTPDILIDTLVKALGVYSKKGKGSEAGSEKRLRSTLEPLGLENDDIVQLVKEGKKNPEAFKKMVASIASQPVTSKEDNEKLSQYQEKVNKFNNSLADIGTALEKLKIELLLPVLENVNAFLEKIRDYAARIGLISESSRGKADRTERERRAFEEPLKKINDSRTARGVEPIAFKSEKSENKISISKTLSSMVTKLDVLSLGNTLNGKVEQNQQAVVNLTNAVNMSGNMILAGVQSISSLRAEIMAEFERKLSSKLAILGADNVLVNTK